MLLKGVDSVAILIAADKWGMIFKIDLTQLKGERAVKVPPQKGEVYAEAQIGPK